MNAIAKSRVAPEEPDALPGLTWHYFEGSLKGALMFEREYISIFELAKRWGCSVEKIIELGSNQVLCIYTYVDTEGIVHFSEFETFSAKVEGIYKLNKLSLLKALLKKDALLTVNDRFLNARSEEEEECYKEEFNYRSLHVDSIYYNWDFCIFDFEFKIEDLFVILEEIKAYEDFMEISPISQSLSTEKIKSDDFPKELKIAIQVFKEFWQDRPQVLNPAPEELINKYIIEKMGGNVSGAAMERIRTIARPEQEKNGGAPRSEAKYYRGRSQNPSA